MFDFLDLDRYDLFGAFWTTVQLTVFSAIGSLILGTLLAAMRVSPVPVMRAFGTAYVHIFRNTPLTLIIVACSQLLALTLGMTMWADVGTDTMGFRLAVLGFVVYTSTFVCEAVRSGINTVPVGQAEAARALGLSFAQVLTMIVLPQAFRSVVAPLANVLIALTKNTTVAAAIGVSEAALLMRDMIEQEAQLVPIATLFAFGFIVLTLPTGLLLGRLSKRVAVKR
ncbi:MULTISPECIES: amino acid ABC transporter permease [unclassified Streptomyces]|uniref:Amino acid ABC transporter permease n=1 Tax=Streptomyces johnsoniae TaxID=3075532 RepID=A0ABU2SEB1_9ACTN|nr:MULTISPECIES: amino acid ABC transporter permease [unclassified Streptomyces]MDT0446189.1 amino acid ABC transporter permease [Streptomyces sp. DSM 41886]ONK10786.1 putative glutamine ABC transporter permease protein GlnM [Streptomyces sp. MP131-18]